MRAKDDSIIARSELERKLRKNIDLINESAEIDRILGLETCKIWIKMFMLIKIICSVKNKSSLYSR